MEIVQGGPTKPEIAAITLSKLNLNNSDVFADIGCGTGRISMMAAKLARQVYAIDDREEAIIAASQNILDKKIDNIKLLLGEAPSVLDKLPSLDCAFVGGTRNIEGILRILKEKVKGRIVVNAVRIQTVSTIIETMQELGIFKEAIHVQVSKNYPLAGEIILKPLNPVYILVGDTNNKKEDH